MHLFQAYVLRSSLSLNRAIRYITVISLLFVSNLTHAQSSDDYLLEFIGNTSYSAENSVLEYSEYDFSGIWTATENHKIVGIIGDEHRRIKVKFTTVERSPTGVTQYQLLGKSSVMGNVCDFTGAINIKQIHLISENDNQVSTSKNSHARIRGVLVADYELLENTYQHHVGIFSGKVYSKWYLDSLNRVVYDDTEVNSVKYINNAFIGMWRSYEGNDKRKCNWGDYRVPLANRDFDNGSTPFKPGKKYRSKDWSNYLRAWIEGDSLAKENELLPWWQ